MRNTNIEWCHHTVNFWWGCIKVSAACLHCYAETLAKLFSRGRASWGPTGLRWIRTTAALRDLRKLDKDAGKRGVVERVFINSMSDTFEDRRDLDEARAALFSAACTVANLQLLLLTKRPENIRRMVPAHWLLPGQWPAHVWIGTTVENQEAANVRVPILLDVPAQVRFLSMEPLLGPVDLITCRQQRGPHFKTLEGTGWLGFDEPRIHWMIVGGESGAGARPMHPQWVQRLREQCAFTDVPFFFKQWGEYLPQDQQDAAGLEWVVGHSDYRNHDWEPGNFASIRIGKKAAGRLLDGIIHQTFPLVL